MLGYTINERQAGEIAARFLRQHHSISRVKRPVFHGGVWTVEIHVSSPLPRTIRVQVEAATGLIVGFEKYIPARGA